MSEDVLANIDPIWDEVKTSSENDGNYWNSRSAKNIKIFLVIGFIIWAILNSFKGGKGGSRKGGSRGRFSGGSSGGCSSSRSSGGRISGGRGGGGSSGGGGASR